MSNEQILVRDGKIEDNKIILNRNFSVISKDTFKCIEEELKDKLLLVEGVDESSYDNSDDDRCGCYHSRYPFAYYYEIDPIKNSKHLLRINGEIKGVVFTITSGYRDVYYYSFLFDGSIKNSITLGYSASHSSNYIIIEKVSLVKRGEGKAPDEGKTISFQMSKSTTYI